MGRHSLQVLAIMTTILLVAVVGCHGGRDGTVSDVGADTGTGLCQAGLRGDLNGSGTPDITDAVGILRIIVGLDPANALADCDCDGATGITDAIALLRCLVGLTPWPLTCGDPIDEMLGPDGQTLVWVPQGSFMMGSEEKDDEQPVRQVTLDAFWIGRCEVTNTQYAAFLNAAAPPDIASWMDMASPFCGIELVEGVYQPRTGLGDHPVVVVTWYCAVAYCDHHGYALPTEAQWEYAAAGPNARRYPWGDDWGAARCCNSENPGPQGTTSAIGSFINGASWCGALDMAGNALEWSRDWYDEAYYEWGPPVNPPGPPGGTWKVLRGGAWDLDADGCRCAGRHLAPPGGTWQSLGFRVAQVADGA